MRWKGSLPTSRISPIDVLTPLWGERIGIEAVTSLERVQAGRTPSLPMVRPEIAERLAIRRRKEAEARLIARLRSEAEAAGRLEVDL